MSRTFRMRVLGLASYPVESAATRFRLAQFVDPLARDGIELTVSPFLDRRQFAALYDRRRAAGTAGTLVGPLLKRISQIADVRTYDVLLVQREAMFLGPAVFERIYKLVGRLPLVLDLDDATYIRYVSPSYGRIGSFFKFFGKTNNLIKTAAVVICGNRYIAEHVNSLGTDAVVIPTVVDTDEFKPASRTNPVPVIGWIGTHSTFPFLERLFPVLERLAAKHRFVLKVVGGGEIRQSIDGVEIVGLPWTLDDEVQNFQSLDIGLYPMMPSDSANEQWLQGKSGFKAIQYMAVGIPFVMSPIGVGAELGEPGVTHFNATSDDDWYTQLEKLLSDETLRIRMGDAGRRHSLENFTIKRQADTLAATLRSVCDQTDV